MAELWPVLGHFAPFIALGLLLCALVVAVNVLGCRLERHAEWLRLLDGRVNNLHKDRRANWVRTLQAPQGRLPLVPPPLPPHAPTPNAIDWGDDKLLTEELQKKDTGRYPHGQPPKGPNDDDTTT